MTHFPQALCWTLFLSTCVHCQCMHRMAPLQVAELLDFPPATLEDAAAVHSERFIERLQAGAERLPADVAYRLLPREAVLPLKGWVASPQRAEGGGMPSMPSAGTARPACPAQAQHAASPMLPQELCERFARAGASMQIEPASGGLAGCCCVT